MDEDEPEPVSVQPRSSDYARTGAKLNFLPRQVVPVSLVDPIQHPALCSSLTFGIDPVQRDETSKADDVPVYRDHLYTERLQQPRARRE